MKIYKNYGVLGMEKVPVYSYLCPHDRGTCYDELTCELPEGWSSYCNEGNLDVLVAPDGTKYSPEEVLRAGEVPTFETWSPEQGYQSWELKVLETVEY